MHSHCTVILLLVSRTTLNNRMEEGDGWLSPPLSFAEEMKLLKSSAEVKTAVSDSTDLQHVGPLPSVFRLLNLRECEITQLPVYWFPLVKDDAVLIQSCNKSYEVATE